MCALGGVIVMVATTMGRIRDISEVVGVAVCLALGFGCCLRAAIGSRGVAQSLALVACGMAGVPIVGLLAVGLLRLFGLMD